MQFKNKWIKNDKKEAFTYKTFNQTSTIITKSELPYLIYSNLEFQFLYQISVYL